MKFAISNYRAIRQANFTVDKIALVAGLNEAGKTSIAQAIASAILGESVVVDDVKVSEAGALVHSGAAKATIDIEGPGGTVSLTLPKGNSQSTGQKPPQASRYALGMLSVLDIDPKDRTRIILEYLKAEPAKSDLAAAMPELDEAGVATAWTRIESLGWDSAWARAKEIGARLKGQWEGHTNERYGSNKSQNWTPQNWSPELASSSASALAQELTDAQAFLETAISGSAVDTEKRARLESDAAKIEGFLDDVGKKRAEVEDLSQAITSLKSERDSLPQPQVVKDPNAGERKLLTEKAAKLEGSEARLTTAREELASAESNLKDSEAQVAAMPMPEAPINGTLGHCPSCKKPLMFSGGKFIVPPAKKKEATGLFDERTQAITKAQNAIVGYRRTIGELNREIGNLEALIKDAKDAGVRLKTLPPPLDLTAAENEATARRTAIAAADAAIKKNEDALAIRQRELGGLEAGLQAAQQAQVELQSMPEGNVTEDEVNRCREAVRLAEGRLAAFKAKTEADRLSGDIALNQKMVGLFSPEGLRQAKLVSTITAFNERIAALCKVAGWKAIEFDRDLMVSYGEWAWRLLSESAQYRVRCVVQLAMAQMDGSELVICDGADILDTGQTVDGMARGRPGLLKLLAHLQIPAILLMTERRDRVANLATVELGQSYWLDNGTLVPMVQQ